MKALQTIKEKTNSSNFMMAKHLGLSQEMYMKVEASPEKDIPEKILQIIQEKLADGELEKSINDNYSNIKQTLESTPLDDIIANVNLTYSDIAVTCGLLLSDVQDALKLKSGNDYDMIVDYVLWIKHLEEVHSNKEVPQVQDNVTQEEPIIQETIEEPQVLNQTNTNGEEVAGLSRQLDWYEEIISCFCRLSNLADRK